MWSKDELKKVVAERSSALGKAGPKMERAALLYARWQGLTEEPKADRDRAKQELDALIEVMEPEEWDGLDTIVNTLGEGTFKGLLSYAMNRALESSADQARSVAKMKDWPVGGSDNDSEGDRDR